MEVAKNILLEQLNTLFPDNNQGLITPQRVRDFLRNVVDSVHVKSDDSISSNQLFANVKDYGAVGDGSTDDYNAFASAIETGMNLFVPKGSYMVNGRLNLQEGQSLIGSIGGSQIIFGTHSDNECLLLGEQSHVKCISLTTLDSNKALIKIETDNTLVENVLMNSGIGVLVAYESGFTPYKTQILNCIFIGDMPSAIRLTRDNFSRTVVTGCVFVNNVESLSLHAWNIDVVDSKFYNTTAVRLYEDEIVAYPVIKFTGCEFINNEDFNTIVNDVKTTATMIHFCSCKLVRANVQMETISSTMSFLGCCIDNITFNNIDSVVSIRMNECSFRELPKFTGIDCSISYGTNMIIDEDATQWVIKTNEL